MKLTIGKYTTAIIYLAVFCLILATMTFAGFSDSEPEVMFFIYLMGMTFFLLLVSGDTLRTSNDKILFWGAFLIKVAYALYRFPINSTADPSLGGDAGGFWRTALQYYDGNFSRVYTPFPYVLNFEFHIFGKNVLCCCVTNIVLSMLMVFLVIKIMNKLEIYGTGRFWAEAVSAFLVWGILVSSSIWREAIYFAFITWSFAQYIGFVYSKRYGNLFAAILLMIPVLILHVGYFPIVAVYLFDLFRREKVKNNKDFFYRFLIVIAFLIFIVAASRVNNVGNTYISAGFRFVDRLSGGESSGVYLEEAGSRYLTGLRITSLPTLVLYSPIRLFYYLFSPLPTNWRGITDILSFLLDSVVHIAFFALSFKGLKLSKTDSSFESINHMRIIKAGLWAVILCGFVFGLGTTTAGTAIRHRDVMIGVESILIGVSMYLLKCRHRTAKLM